MTTFSSRIGKATGECPYCTGIARYDTHQASVCEDCSSVLFEPSYNHTTTLLLPGKIPITAPDYRVPFPETGHAISIVERVGNKIVEWEWD